jgi:hypothetical protein
VNYTIKFVRLKYLHLYNNTPSIGIVDAVPYFSYRSLLETVNTGQWYIPMFLQFFMNELKNFNNVVIRKLGKLGHKKLFSRLFLLFINYNIIIVQVDILLLKQKTLPVLDLKGFFFHMSTLSYI